MTARLWSGGLVLLGLTALWAGVREEHATPQPMVGPTDGGAPKAPTPAADRAPLLRVSPLVAHEGQQATATVEGLLHPTVPTWRWARLVVEAADGSVPIDSVWQLPARPVRRTWQLRGGGDTVVTLTLLYASGREADRISRTIMVR